VVSILGGMQTFQGRFLFSLSVSVTSPGNRDTCLDVVAYDVRHFLYPVRHFELGTNNEQIHISLDEYKSMHLEGPHSTFHALKNLPDLPFVFFIVYRLYDQRFTGEIP
jgi:hypothetical protein